MTETVTKRSCVAGHQSGRRKNGACIQCARDAQLRWRLAHPEQNAKNQRARHERRFIKPVARCNHILVGARNRAKKKGIEFSLTVDWLLPKIEAGVCELTGLTFNMVPALTGRQQPMSPSLDRRDAAKGYTPDNCRVVLWAVNCALSDFGEDVFAMIAQAYLNQRGNLP